MAQEHWMSKLPEQLRRLPIINLAIPGSHNSMSYGINRNSRIAPDASTSLRRLNYFFSWFVRRWAKTQTASILEQLQLGVRFFDLRIAQEDNKYYYAHGLFAMEVYEPLIELCTFLDTHPGEVVILDLQHFYALNVSQHYKFQKQLLNIFGERLYACTDGRLSECTLKRCNDLKRQVIIIYRRSPISLPVQFWPSHDWPTPWPNVASTKKLKNFLELSLLTRQPTIGYVSQCVLTPTARYIALRCFSSLQRVAKRVNKQLKPWILEQCPGCFDAKGPHRINVFISDFVNIKDGEFCALVVGLNNKLYPNKLDNA